MAINNLNPRRTVWFSPHEPSNKYDIWLSKNAHLDENGEPTTDSSAQRACDYIFRIYDCGLWNPIVGFNSTARYKINIVDGVNYTYTIPNTLTSHTNNGFQQNHLPLFRNPEDSPNELFDAGTLGEALYGFVTEAEWNTLFNANWFQSAFNTSIIGGNNYNWSNIIQELISGGDVEIPLANTLRIGGIKAALDPNSGDEPRNIPIVLAGPEQGSVWGLPFGSGYYPQNKYPGDLDHDTEYLYLPGWALIDWMENPGPGVEIPVPYTPSQIIQVLEDVFKNTSSIGWSILSTASNPSISPEIYGINRSAAGRYLRIKPDFTGGIPEGGWNQSNCAVEWVDLPEGTVYTQGTGITISQQNEISINTIGASTGQVLTKTANGVGWTTQQQTTYTAGAGIDVTETTISGLVRLDEESTTATSSVVIDTMSITQSFPKGGCRINIDNEPLGGVLPYHYKIINFSPEKNSTLKFDVLNSITYLKGDPVYFKININSLTEPSDITVSFGNDGEYIIHNEALVANNAIYTFNPKFYKYLVTILFGIVEIKPIKINSSSN